MIFENIDKLKYNIEIETGIIPNQPKELYYGNREYKLKIVNCDDKKIIKRSTQMLFRLHEGNGKAIYLIGIDDDGNIKGLILEDLNKSLNNIIKIAEKSCCNIKKIKIYQFIDNNSEMKYILIIRIFKVIDNNQLLII